MMLLMTNFYIALDLFLTSDIVSYTHVFCANINCVVFGVVAAGSLATALH